jgi:hypothetical protein
MCHEMRTQIMFQLNLQYYNFISVPFTKVIINLFAPRIHHKLHGTWDIYEILEEAAMKNLVKKIWVHLYLCNSVVYSKDRSFQCRIQFSQFYTMYKTPS